MQNDSNTKKNGHADPEEIKSTNTVKMERF